MPQTFLNVQILRNLKNLIVIYATGMPLNLTAENGKVCRLKFDKYIHRPCSIEH